MKIYPLIYTAILTLPLAQADISLGKPAAPQAANENAYHSDLLASNVVLAAFKELRTVPVVDIQSATPATEEIAVFEVKQNIAHRRYDRMGDNALQPGKLFPVSLGAAVPGQDATLGETIRQMKPGDEAIMKMDHIYIFREEGNENVRACTRFVKADTPADTDQTPPTADDMKPSVPDQEPTAREEMNHPLIRFINNSKGASAQSYSTSSSVSITSQPDAQGVMRTTKVEIRRERHGDTETVRKFINDVEVDPNTDQPLEPTPRPAAPAPAPAANDELPPIPEPPADPT